MENDICYQLEQHFYRHRKYRYLNFSPFRVHGGLEPLVELIAANRDNVNKDNKVGLQNYV